MGCDGVPGGFGGHPAGVAELADVWKTPMSDVRSEEHSVRVKERDRGSVFSLPLALDIPPPTHELLWCDPGQDTPPL